ncbi:LysR family transcriptional regulator [uncultured delta proteobacterium]|uniref:LysR family transcriptional regulator n=1 Tax=uncultured delta proteobacterium TaxID=34034 RepID=A0A212K4Q4_9DELT|nr:LysR family transcriptional regulator [uncultured delta proteobacterium]
MTKKMQLLPEKVNWALLHTYLVIVEKRNLSLAAARLNLTQSAVSHSLKKLEAQVGARLLERSHRHFSLTEQGQMLHEAALSMYRELGRLDDSLRREGSAISDTISILILSRVQNETFDEFLMGFRQRYPKIKLQLETMLSADILNRLNQKISAIGLTLCGREMKNLNRVLLLPQRYALYCGKHHPLFAKEKIRKQDLRAQPFVSWFSDQLGDTLSPLTVFREAEQLTGEVVAHINSIDELRRLIYIGYGIGCLPEHLARKDEIEGNLRRLPPEKGIADVPIYLVWHKQRKLKLAEIAFMEGLCATFNQEEAWREASRAQGTGTFGQSDA